MSVHWLAVIRGKTGVHQCNHLDRCHTRHANVRPGVFGPVATVYVVQDEAEAIKLANDSSYGLGGCVFTRDIDRGRRVAEQIETGMIFVNQPTKSQAELPFGGIKNFGYGRELSYLGILEFVNKKLIHLGD